jgi:AraC-like DNA-binding protein
MFLDLIYMFMIMAAGLAILLGIHLLKVKEKKLPNMILGISMLFYAVNLLDVFSIISGYSKQHPHLTAVTAVFPYIYGPLLYLFAKSISEKLEKFSRKDYLHFLPFIILTIIGFPLYFLRDAEFKLAMANGTADAPVLSFVGMFIPVAGIIYVVLSARIFNNYRKKIKQNFSNIDRINMEWLRYYIWGSGAVWFFVVVAYSVEHFLPKWFIPNLIIYVPVSGFIWWISYISLSKQSSYLVNSAEIEKEPITPAYSRSGLTDEQAELTIVKLQSLIQTEKPYKNSSLKLQDLSGILDVPPHYLTEILNTRLNQNFYDYINSFRVEEVKRLIKEDKDKKFNLLSLALEAGFSSKSSFNSIFKKHTGLTPSEYRNQSAAKNAA